MHRSLLYYLRQQVQHIKLGFVITSCENGRVCAQKMQNQFPYSSAAVNKTIHTSVRSWGTDNDDKKEQGSQTKPRSSKNKKSALLSPDEEQMKIAAAEAAKSLPGDWTRTADELMAQLTMHKDSPVEQSQQSEQEPSQPQSSLLSSMKIERSFASTRQRSGKEEISSRSNAVQNKQFMRKRLARKNTNITSLYGQPRLGIFDAEKIKAAAGTAGKEPGEGASLWHIVAQENIDRARHGPSRNGLEEMIQWTKEGRMWTFPVDNEEGLEEERQYKFHDHVFLQDHLKDFPSEGPVRRFMDLVILGLSKNPWLSVPEKIEHIQWYSDYFREKQQLLESSIGDKAKMKQ